MRINYIVIIIVILSGCKKQSYIDGPELGEGSVQSVRIESLENNGKYGVINDRELITKIEYLFSKDRWGKNHSRKLTPSYKFIITTNKNNHINYWLGSISSLNEFPCYKLCSGWWVASSDSQNIENEKIFKVLASSTDMFLVAEIVDMAENQPNK